MGNSEVVFLYGPSWDAPARLSKHHLARYWARTRRVLYVESPPNPLSFYTRFEEARALWERYRQGPIEVTEQLFVHTYFYPLPFWGGSVGFGGRWVNKCNQMIVRPQLSKRLQALDFNKPVLLVCSAHALPLVDHIPHRLLMYHCSDDYTAVPSRQTSFDQLERELIQRCDVVITTSDELRRAKENLNPSIVTVRNGVDFEHFSRTQAETEVAHELAGLPRPVVGYIGSVFRWIEQEWISQAARLLPTWSFVFIGPRQTNVSRLEALPNVHFLGPRPYNLLPEYLRGFDVATVPFTSNQVTLRASPIKFYEYLAAGIPVVATRLPDLEPLAEFAHLVTSAEGFTSALQQAVSQDTPESRQRRVKESRRHSWEARYVQLDAVIENIAGNRFR